MSSYNNFKKYQVQAESVTDFLNRYYKRDRFTGRGKEYAERLIKTYHEELEKEGFCFISHHDSVTGEVVAYYK